VPVEEAPPADRQRAGEAAGPAREAGCSEHQLVAVPPAAVSVAVKQEQAAVLPVSPAHPLVAAQEAALRAVQVLALVAVWPGAAPRRVV
jgi:hypothetical protein